MHYKKILIACAVMFVASHQINAEMVYVIDSGVSGHNQVQNAINGLNSLGYAVSTGGTLGDYTAFDQVWDLRYVGNLTSADITAMGDYLASGGRMYLTGEHSGFDSSRNISLVNFLNSVGAGPINLVGNVGYDIQDITAEGQIVNSPNSFADVTFNAARVAAETGSGFLVTETFPDSGAGSLLGWDFGDIAGASSARMLVGFDIEIFQNGTAWTENMATYLGAEQPVVPEPTSIALWGLGTLAMGVIVRRRKRKEQRELVA
jgi:hypothetical protein